MARLEQRLEKLEQHQPDEAESLDGLSPSEQWKRLCDQGRHPPRNAPAMSAAEAWRECSAALASEP